MRALLNSIAYSVFLTLLFSFCFNHAVFAGGIDVQHLKERAKGLKAKLPQKMPNRVPTQAEVKQKVSDKAKAKKESLSEAGKGELNKKVNQAAKGIPAAASPPVPPVQVPAVQVPAVQAPAVQVPAVQAPAVPQMPSAPRF